MCGIAGLVGFDDVAEAHDRIASMLAKEARRGPDDEGVCEWRGVVFGHRRLAILDLTSRGHQPMRSEDGRLGVVFNGAIYNFIELREDLRRSGASFRSGTDTEVLLHGYRRWGLNGLVRRLRGMYAFALWDDERRRLCLARDPLGVKPLLFAESGPRFAFASTADALVKAGFQTALDETAITQFLQFGFVPEGCSIWQGIRKLPPGSVLEWHGGRSSERSYWQPPAAGSNALPFDQAVEGARELFLRATERRLRADVPVGALLSGGIDSGLVCWALTQLNADVTAYTVATPGETSDEAALARRTARLLGLTHEVVTVPDAGESPLGELANAYGEPFACASALGMLRLSRAASSRARVVLTGDGGDDVFLGYPRHRFLLAAQTIANRLPSGARRWWASVRRFTPSWKWARRAAHFADYATGGLGSFVNAGPGTAFFDSRGVWGPFFASGGSRALRIDASMESARRVLDDYLEFDIHHQFVSEYLTKVDGATMYFGVEARSPFLDQDLWEFAAGLPYGVRLHRGRLKAVLRSLATAGLGPEVARGRKRGFEIPAPQWLLGPWRQTVVTAFHQPASEELGLFAKGALSRVWNECSETGTAPLQLWYILVLELWLRNRSLAWSPPLPPLAPATGGSR